MCQNTGADLPVERGIYRLRRHTLHSAAWIAFFLVILLIREDAGSVMTDSTTASAEQELERGKNIGRLVTSKELYQAYQEIQHEYHEKAFGKKDWKILNQKDGIEIALLHHESDPSCPYVRMSAVIRTPVTDCWNFLKLANWDKTMPKMDPFYEGLSVFGEYQYGGAHMLLARKRTKRIITFGKRDFVFVSVSDVPRKDGVHVSGTVSVIAPQMPRRQGYTRAYQDSIAFYEPIDNGKQTRLTIVCRIDLNDHSDDGKGGNMPMWLYVKTIGQAGYQSVKSMRHHIHLEYEDRTKVLGQSEKISKKGRFILPWGKRRKEDKNGAFEIESLEPPKTKVKRKFGLTIREKPKKKEEIESLEQMESIQGRSKWSIPKVNLPWSTKTK